MRVGEGKKREICLSHPWSPLTLGGSWPNLANRFLPKPSLAKPPNGVWLMWNGFVHTHPSPTLPQIFVAVPRFSWIFVGVCVGVCWCCCVLLCVFGLWGTALRRTAQPRFGSRGGHQGFTRQPGNSKRAHWRVPALETQPKFPERDRKSEFLGFPPFEADFFWVWAHFLGPTMTHTPDPHLLPKLDWPNWPNQDGQNRIGQCRSLPHRQGQK